MFLGLDEDKITWCCPDCCNPATSWPPISSLNCPLHCSFKSCAHPVGHKPPAAEALPGDINEILAWTLYSLFNSNITKKTLMFKIKCSLVLHHVNKWLKYWHLHRNVAFTIKESSNFVFMIKESSHFDARGLKTIVFNYIQIKDTF